MPLYLEKVSLECRITLLFRVSLGLTRASVALGNFFGQPLKHYTIRASLSILRRGGSEITIKTEVIAAFPSPPGFPPHRGCVLVLALDPVARTTGIGQTPVTLSSSSALDGL